jgi:hypothetical protein
VFGSLNMVYEWIITHRSNPCLLPPLKHLNHLTLQVLHSLSQP